MGPTPAPTPALDTASESDSPSDSPVEDVNRFMAKAGCCRDSESESKKTIQGFEYQVTVGANIMEAVEECMNFCASVVSIGQGKEREDVVCTAVELTTKKKKGNKGKSMHTCEIHTGNVDRTTRKTKSCKRAVCFVNNRMVSDEYSSFLEQGFTYFDDDGSGDGSN